MLARADFRGDECLGEETMTTKTLALRLGCSAGQIGRLARKAGVEPTMVGPTPTWTEAQARIIKKRKRTHRPGRPRKDHEDAPE